MVCGTCHRVLAGYLQGCLEGRYQDDPKGGSSICRSFCHSTLKSLQRSVDEKCWPCSTFWFSLTPEQRDAICLKVRSCGASRVHPDGEFVTMANPLWPWDPNSSKNTLSFAVGGHGHLKSFIVHELANFQFPIFRHLDSLPLSRSTESPETLSLAKDWIDSCLKNHTRCNFVPQAVWYPTRLLDSGALDANDTPKIKLIETPTTVIDGPYMTLSHSWGKGHSLTLNKTSYQTLLDGVTPSVLPQTFREASDVARQLGVRYVWIDALCIFQDKDDLSDWNREASLMHKVYAHSLCNIVAAETPDSSHSMFASRDPTTMLPAYSEECVDISLDGTWTTRKYILTDERFKKEFDDSTIHTRPWVMQERYMSPRALYFGRRQLFWECREAEAAETNPFGVTLGQPGLKSRYEDVRDYLDKKSVARTRNAQPGRVDFYHLVGEYSRCATNLSFHSDKLIAFSAILKQYSTVHNEEMVAGMRRRCLENDLLWTRPYSYNSVQGQVDLPCYETYIAPSWSWASVRGSIVTHKWDGEHERILFHVEDYKLDYVTEDTTGAIRGGWLRLSGLLKRVKLRRTHLDVNYASGWELEIDGFELVDRDSPNMHDFSLYLDSWVDNFDHDNDDGSLFCMATKSVNECTDSLLLKLVDASTGTFRRLGAVMEAKGLLTHFLTVHGGSDCADSEQGKLPCIEYKDGRHSIYII